MVVTVTAVPVNAAPVLAADGTATVVELTAESTLFTSVATDPESDAITYSLATEPGFSIDSVTGVISVDNSVVAGSYTLHVTATATGGTDTQDVVVTVTP